MVETFQDILLSEFVRRKGVNSSYSLRAYAQYLKVDQSLLSKVLKNKRKPSQAMIEASLRTLGHKERSIQKIIRNEKNVTSYRMLKDDEFEILSDWIHFAILQLIGTKGFESSPAWIAKRLGVTTVQIEKALGRLTRIGKVNIIDGEYQATGKTHTWDCLTSTTVARRLFQKRLLELGAKKIEEIPFDDRENSSLTIACSKQLLPEVKKKILRFKKDLDNFITAHGKQDEVYQLIVGFYPLTQIKKEINKKGK